MSAPATAPNRTSTSAPVLLGVAIVLVALNLRAPITSVPPLLVTISEDLHLGGAAAGLLTTLPVLCMGVFAPLAQQLARRTGRERAVSLALLLVLAGTLIRLGGGVAVVLYAGALLAGVGIAIAGTLLPGVIKEYFAGRTGLVTGIYMGGMMVSAALAAQLSVPLAHALSSWPASLAAWSVLGVVALLVWVPVSTRARAHAGAEDIPPRSALPWRSATAWLLALYLVCNSWEFYTQVAWIPATYESLGRAPASAAELLTAFTVTQAFAGVGGPALADRVRDLRLLLVPAVVLTVVGTLGVALVPQAAPVLWMVILGVGLGAGFPLGLVLLVLYARTPAASGRLTAMAFLVSYSVASIGPVVFGALKDASGGVRAPWLVLVVVALVQLAFVARLGPDRPPVD